jgi:hypothetical protein
MLAECIARTEGKVEADKFVEDVGWLPLREEWAKLGAALQLPEPQTQRRKVKRS